MVTAVSKLQLKLDFEPGITEQFRSLEQCVAAVVYGYRGGMAAVAAACDCAPSTLSRMLNENPDDPRHLPLKYLAPILAITKDTRPIQWLAASFIPDDDTRRDMALSRLEQILPSLVADLADLKRARR